MFCFEENELEIALVTYNRPQCIKEWLSNCLEGIIDRNINFTIYDSSETLDTRDIVDEYNKKYEQYVKYIRIDKNVAIGVKPMLVFANSVCDYIWVCVDRRWHDFEEMDEYIFPKIKEKKYATIIVPEKENKLFQKEYSSVGDMFVECGGYLGHLGDMIYSKFLFDSFEPVNQWLENNKDKEYVSSYGFMAYHLQAVIKHPYLTYAHSIKMNHSGRHTTFSWSKNLLKYWIDDNICIVRDSPDGYIDKERWYRECLGEFRDYVAEEPDTILYYMRVECDLSQVYDLFEERDYWDQLNEFKAKIEYYAKTDLQSIRKQRILIDMKSCADGDLIDVLSTNIDQIGNHKKVFIYGAGDGGRIVGQFLKENGIAIEGYIDKNADSIKSYEEKEVYLPEYIEKDSLVIISLKNYYLEVEQTVEKFTPNIMYLCKMVCE